MATTAPQEFPGIPSLSEAKVAVIKEWYLEALGDSDKAGDAEDESFYTGQHQAYSSVLHLLYGSGAEVAP